MYYEFNISFRGKHLFATHERSCKTEDQAAVLYNLFSDYFRTDDGYHISVTKFELMGEDVEMQVRYVGEGKVYEVSINGEWVTCIKGRRFGADSLYYELSGGAANVAPSGYWRVKDVTKTS